MSAASFVLHSLQQSASGDKAFSVLQSKVQGRFLLLESGAVAKQPSAHGGIPRLRIKRAKQKKQWSQIMCSAAASLNRNEQHEAWLAYARTQLQGVDHTNTSLLALRLSQLDRHGALIQVVRSPCPSLLHVQGILLQETKRTVTLLGDRLTCIPKKDIVFEIQVPVGAGLTLYSLDGNKL